jgi:hypothetical protein
MLRRLFTLLSAMSLLLCVGTCVLWAGSGFDLVQGHYIRSPQPDESRSLSFQASSYSGTLRFEFTRRDFGPVYLHGLSAEALERFGAWYPTGLRWRIAGGAETIFRSVPAPGFQAGHYVDPGSAGYRSETWVLAVRHWLPTALLLVMPAVRLNRFRKARRATRLGLCPACGYDLRATPDRCPECGTVR